MAKYSLLFLFLSAIATTLATGEDHRIQISISEFQFEGVTYARTTIDADRSRVEGSPLDHLSRPSEWLNGNYALFLLKHLQRNMGERYQSAGRRNDGTPVDKTIFNLLNNISDPFGSVRKSYGEITKIEQLLIDGAKIVFFTRGNDLNQMMGSFKFVPSIYSRIMRDVLVSEGLTESNFEQAYLQSDSEAAARGQQNFEIENLFLAKGPYDFSRLLGRSIVEMGFLGTSKPSNWLQAVGHQKSYPLYIAMGFLAYFRYGGLTYLSMDADKFSDNFERFCNGEILNQDRLFPINLKRVRAYQAVRRQKMEVIPTHFSPVDFTASIDAVLRIDAARPSDETGSCSSQLAPLPIPFY